MQPDGLIRYIVWYAGQQGVKLTTNRLVKFLYLADLYEARAREGKTITGFPWRFVYYGPYCPEAMQSIEETARRGLVCKQTFDSTFDKEKSYSLFSCNDHEAEKLQQHFRMGTLSQLQSAIKRFGEDTPLLLDYVYFETEPMKDAKKGDLLDFSKAQQSVQPRAIQLKKISKEKIELARNKIRLIGERQKEDRQRVLKEDAEIEKYKDESYQELKKSMDGEELAVGSKGIAIIRLTE